MAQARAPKHAMKMGVSPAKGPEIGRHEHGMDRDISRDDGSPARLSPKSNVRGDP